MEVAPEIVERMVALIETLAANGKNTSSGVMGYADEAKAIVKLLPEPIDPDLPDARKIAATDGMATLRAGIIAGNYDHAYGVKVALAGIKRGRHLSRSSS